MRINHKIGGVERTSKFDRSRYACGILIVIFRPQSNDKLKPPLFTLLYDASSMINRTRTSINRESEDVVRTFSHQPISSGSHLTGR